MQLTLEDWMGFSAPTTSFGNNWNRKDYCIAALLSMLSFYMAFCAIWIGILNWISGNPLPHETRGGKWRISASVYDDPSISVDERQRRASERRLRDAVGLHGVIQYVLCPIATFVGAACLVSGKTRGGNRILGILTIGVAMLGLSIAFWFKYWSSLGW